MLFDREITLTDLSFKTNLYTGVGIECSFFLKSNSGVVNGERC